MNKLINMNKLIYLLIGVFTMSLIGCEDFLDVQSYTNKNEQTFPKTEKDANELLTGVYAVLNDTQGRDAWNCYLITAELASDDRFGGGGNNDAALWSVNHLLQNDANKFRDFWRYHYNGVARATGAITALEAAMEEGDLKNQKLGEAKVLRSQFYFELVQTLGDVPLIKASPENVDQAMESPQQSTQEEVFTQIGTDLWEAVSTMPDVRWNDMTSGTITKWTAAGLLARVWLFYTGFYGEKGAPKTSMPREGGSITKDDVLKYLNECIEKSGHSLVPDFRSLWTYTNSVTKPSYPFAADAPTWVRDGSNPEHVFVIKHIGLNTWGNIHFTNQLALFFSIRNDGDGNRYKNIYPMGQGWGAGPVSNKLWDDWLADEPDDIRRQASIYNVELEATSYKFGGDAQMEETGLWQKKIVGITAYGKNNDPTQLYNSFFSSSAYEGYVQDNFQIAHASDLILIRYADILLMHSEISGTADGMNAVRARAKLPSVAYSLDAIKKERRYELAFEGVRWGDIRRWQIAEEALGNMYGIKIYNSGVQTVMKTQGNAGDVVKRYKDTKGFFMKPQYEIDLSNGSIQQNAGWTGVDFSLTTYDN